MYFQRQSFVVVGLSRSGVSACEFLRAHGAVVRCYDDGAGEALAEAERSLEEKGCVILTKDTLEEGSAESDILVLSPGVPIDHPLPVAFRRAGKRVVGEAELGALALGAPCIAVTGTNGKTSVVTLIDAMLRASHIPSVACGNIGTPITACAGHIPEGGVAVAEISSFQLETLVSLRPHIAVVTNISEDHLNRHYNMQNYIYLKSRLLKNSTESEYAVLNYDDERVRAFAEGCRAQVYWFSLRERVKGAHLADGQLCWEGEPVLPAELLGAEGEHNIQNALAALVAAKLAGAKTQAICAALTSFRGVAHRIERVGRVRGVCFIDDSKATNVDAAIKAIASMREETVLLVGGKDKGYSYEPLFEAAKRSLVVHAVLYGENAFRLLEAALHADFTAVTLCRPFDVAVRVAYLTAKEGQNVLLSPASASFDSFRNFEERGERFCALMRRFAEEDGEQEGAREGDAHEKAGS